MRFVTTLCTLLPLALAASRADALTGAASEEADRRSALALTTAREAEDLVSTLQWAVPQSPRGFSLAGQGLLGRYGLTADEVLKELAPHLDACTTKLERSDGRGKTVHETYSIRFGGYPLARATLMLHHHENKLAMLRASLPTYRLPAEPFRDEDFVPLENLGFPPAEGERQTARRVLAESGGFPAPAWEVTRFDQATGITHHSTVDAQTGALLHSSETAFDLAEVYEKGPADGQLITVDLPDLPGTGYLDGKRFTVYAPTAAEPRVMAPDNRFVFRPDDPADQISFDQVEAYYAATRVLAWFEQRFGDTGQGAHVTVRVNDLINGRPDNALYVPPPEGPEIRIGAGNESLTNLARDTDVLTHEYAHHVIYQYLTDHSGESGVIHEGTSDYFAYAVNGDPNLGESIVPGGAFLRTAALAPDDLYDQIQDRKGAHYRGQYWAAVLWDLRQTLGESMDTVVYDSLSYLGPSSGLKDAFLGLLNADRDLHPLEAGHPEHGVYGKHKCQILLAGVQRGFALYLEDYDGMSCGMDMAKLADESRDRIDPPPPRGEGNAFGKPCAVVDRASGAKVNALAWLCFPLFFVVLAGRRRKHGS